MPQTTQKTETDDKIKTALNSILKKWWQLEDQVSNARWKQGKLVHENIEDLTQPEKSALYNRLVRETGQKRETLKKYVWFFKAFPDLPERVKMSGVRASKWMTIAEHGEREIPIDLSIEDIKSMSVRELRNWFSGDAQVPIECDICGANLDFEQQGVEWERIEVCNDCKQKALHFEENLNKMVTRTIELIGRCSKCGGELEGALGSMFKCKECGHIMDPEELKNQFLKEE